MKKKVKRLSVVALAVVTLAVLTGCGTEKVSASASKNQEVHVAVVPVSYTHLTLPTTSNV